MQFTANETQSMLRDSVRRFVHKNGPATAEPGTTAPNAWPTFVGQGWLAAGIAEASGGLGGGAFDVCLIAEELGRGLVREPFVPYAATGRLLASLGDSTLLEGLLWDGATPLLVHSESAARGDSGFVETRARQDGDAFLLTGSKSAILGGDLAGDYLVTARQDDGTLGVFRIAANAPGVNARSYRTIDNRRATNVQLSTVEAEAIASGDEAEAAVLQAADLHLVAAAAEAVGTMQFALDTTRDYLNTRKQFGVTISQFQALQHRLADMFIETEMARSIVLRAAAAVDGDNAALSRQLAAAAKARTGRAARFVGGQAVQLHGGIGVTEECVIGHCYKRLVAFDLAMGPGETHYDRFGGLAAS